MSILRKLLDLFHKDDLYVSGYGNKYSSHDTQNKIFISPGTKIGSLQTVKRQLRKTNQDKEKDPEQE